MRCGANGQTKVCPLAKAFGFSQQGLCPCRCRLLQTTILIPAVIFLVHIGNSWDEILKDEWEKPYYKKLREFLKTEYRTQTVYPKAENIFNALKYTPIENIKCVIIGQDPYHEPGQAEGLSFSVPDEITPPPSLKNIFKEYQSDLNLPMPKSGSLKNWAKNGVLLLNTVLTVRRGAAFSHKGMGWEKVTDRIITEVNNLNRPIVFILWGRPAQNKGMLVTNPLHKKICSVHPSPLSAHGGFFGSRPFSRTNEFLTENNSKPVNWEL